MKSAVPLICAILVGLRVSESAAGIAGINLFADSNCTSAQLCIPPSGNASFQVGVVGAGEVCGGIIGAEFRISGLPAGWKTDVTPGPMVSIVVGDLFEGGVNLSFIGNQAADCLQVFTVQLTPLNPSDTAVLTVSAHVDPNHPGYDCPNVTPTFCGGRACVVAGSLSVNAPEDCSISTAAKSWSEVKYLYRW